MGVELNPGKEVTGNLECKDQLGVNEGQEAAEPDTLISALAAGG